MFISHVNQDKYPLPNQIRQCSIHLSHQQIELFMHFQFHSSKWHSIVTIRSSKQLGSHYLAHIHWTLWLFVQLSFVCWSKWTDSSMKLKCYIKVVEFRMPYFTSFCAFCSVRLGSIVVGILSLVNSTDSKDLTFDFQFTMNEIKFRYFKAQDIVPAFVMISMGSNWFSSFAKYSEEYIKENGLDDDYLPEIRSIDKSNSRIKLFIFTHLQTLELE